MTQSDHNRVRELFKRVVAIPADQRSAWLDVNCRNDTHDRRAVEGLLEYHSELATVSLR